MTRLSGAVCFDATGTLIETRENVGEVYHRVALAHGVDLPAWRLEDAFRRILSSAPPRGVIGDSRRLRRRGEVEWWFERIRETFQATDSTARFEDFSPFASALFDHYCSVAAWRLRPGAREMLQSLHTQGVPMALVSNFDHRLPKILKALDIASVFGFVAIPSEIGYAKPDAAVFRAVAERFDLSPSALTYVGDDSKETLQAIQSQGLAIIDVRDIEDLAALPDRLSTVARLDKCPESSGSNSA